MTTNGFVIYNWFKFFLIQLKSANLLQMNLCQLSQEITVFENLVTIYYLVDCIISSVALFPPHIWIRFLVKGLQIHTNTSFTQSLTNHFRQHIKIYVFIQLLI